MSLKEQLAEYRAAWYQRVPAERQAIMQRHIDQLRSGVIAGTMLKVGDRAPAIVLENATGATVDLGTLLKKGPVCARSGPRIEQPSRSRWRTIGRCRG
jgi:hypothetical protein